MKVFKRKQIAFFLFLIGFASSCAFHGGNVTNSTVISDPNFTVVGLAVGTASTQHVFSIGGLDKEAIILEAKKNMYADYPLQPGQAYGNVILDFKVAYYIVVRKMTCTISADIIDFNKETKQSEKRQLDNKSGENGRVKQNLDGYEIGEQIYFSDNGKPVLGTVINFLGKKIQVRHNSLQGNIQNKTFNTAQLYKLKNDKTLLNHNPNYKIGDSVYFASSLSFKTQRGEIFALGQEGACISYEN